MRWDATPAGRNAFDSALGPTEAQVAARRRFDAAVATVGPGLSEILWRVVCAGEGMRDAELIIACNTDGAAPIFDVAHYGTTVDLFDLVPALADKVG